MRVSQAGLAIFERSIDGTRQWLLVWSKSHDGWCLVGGHRRPDESYRECCQREVTDELQCQPEQFELDAEPYLRLQFNEFSKSARQHTDYQWHVFPGRLVDPQVPQRMTEPSIWASIDDIRNQRAADGRAITPQSLRIFDPFGAF